MRCVVTITVKRGKLRRPVALWITRDKDQIKFGEDPNGDSTATVLLTNGCTCRLVVLQTSKDDAGNPTKIEGIIRDRLTRKEINTMMAGGFQHGSVD
jgi:hypothetical protein